MFLVNLNSIIFKTISISFYFFSKKNYGTVPDVFHYLFKSAPKIKDIVFWKFKYFWGWLTIG